MSTSGPILFFFNSILFDRMTSFLLRKGKIKKENNENWQHVIDFISQKNQKKKKKGLKKCFII